LVIGGPARFNGRVELLPLLQREEVALLLGSLTACGFFILGVLDVFWPPVRRRRPSPAAARPAVARPAAWRAVAAPPAPRPVAAPPAPAEVERPLPPPPSALAVGRLLVARAVSEPDLQARVTILTRAVAGLTRASLARPDDAELAATLSSARARLWATWEEIALARLAAAMPWSVGDGAPAPAAPGRLGALSERATRLTTAS
jgi:hypothetical protein